MKGARLSKLMSKPKVSNNNNISTTLIVVVNNDIDLHAQYWNSFLDWKWISLLYRYLNHRLEVFRWNSGPPVWIGAHGLQPTYPKETHGWSSYQCGHLPDNFIVPSQTANKYQYGILVVVIVSIEKLSECACSLRGMFRLRGADSIEHDGPVSPSERGHRVGQWRLHIVSEFRTGIKLKHGCSDWLHLREAYFNSTPFFDGAFF